MFKSHRRFSAPVRLVSIASFAVAGCAAVAGIGCGSTSSSDSSEANEPSLDALQTQAQNDFASSLQDVSDQWDQCVAAGACQPLDLNAAADSTGAGADAGAVTMIPVTSDAGESTKLGEYGIHLDDGVHPLGGQTLVGSKGSLTSAVPNKICKYLAPIEGIEHLWFYAGANLQMGAGLSAMIGADYVWNLWDQQGAAFVYGGGSIGVYFGVGANVYAGYGADFSGTQNVIDGWSGNFTSISVDLKAKFVGIVGASVSVSGFCSLPSPTLCGVGINFNASIAFDVKNPLPIGLSVSSANWKPWDGQSTEMSKAPWFGFGFTATQENSGGHPYAKFGGAGSMAYSMLQYAGAGGAFGAGAGLALAALRKAGLTIDQMCPNGANGDASAEAGSGSLLTH